MSELITSTSFLALRYQPWCVAFGASGLYEHRIVVYRCLPYNLNPGHTGTQRRFARTIPVDDSRHSAPPCR